MLFCYTLRRQMPTMARLWFCHRYGGGIRGRRYLRACVQHIQLRHALDDPPPQIDAIREGLSVLIVVQHPSRVRELGQGTFALAQSIDVRKERFV